MAEDSLETKQNFSSIFAKIKQFLWEVGPLLILVLAVRSVFFEPFKIPTGSMIPTLYVGDFILVKKFEYGWKVPFLDDYFGQPMKILVQRDPPKRGQIIVFRYPDNPSTHFIKRVVGIPGDKVEVKNKQVFVNEVAQPVEDYKDEDRVAVLKNIDSPQYGEDHMRVLTETLGDVKHTIMWDTQNEYTAYHSTRIVPEGYYFVMGDNRDFSSDSRAWGYVPRENIVGRALFIWFSASIPFSNLGQTQFHFERIGTALK